MPQFVQKATYKMMFEFEARNPDELRLNEGDIVQVKFFLSFGIVILLLHLKAFLFYIYCIGLFYYFSNFYCCSTCIGVLYHYICSIFYCCSTSVAVVLYYLFYFYCSTSIVVVLYLLLLFYFCC